jgi:ABC-type multidrug transport system permease subunit
VFFGTLEASKSYFEDLGFVCGPRQTISEFLVTVTDPKACVVRSDFRHKVPRTASEFADTWRASENYRQMQLEIESRGTDSGRVSEEIARFKTHVVAEKAPVTRHRSPYSLNLAQQFQTTFSRSLRRIRGEYAYFVAITVAMLFIPVLIGTMFYDIDPGTSGFFSKGGVIFFIVLFNIIVNFAEVAAQFSQRPIVEKHHSYGMYHPYIDSLATMVSQFPLKAINILIFTVIVYFMTGLKREVGPFFIFVVFVYLTTLTMTAWFRFVAALASTIELALATAGLTVLPLAMYGGYVIPRPSMHPWFKWISYINPIFYTVEALMAVEFHGREAPCQALVPSGPGFENADVANQVCAVVGSKPGNAFVLGDDYINLSFDYHYSHVWRNLGISIVFFLGFTFLYALTTEFKKLNADGSSYMVFRRGSRGSTTTSYCENPGEEKLALEPNRDVLCWKHLNYHIQIKGKERQLLQDVQGYVEPGKLTALMGASGAGM